jgi:bifunctional non-homologous end joining protein LigD
MFIHSSVCAHVFRGRVSKRLCEVAFTEWTRDGRIRHPSFEGLREDKDASQVKKDQPMQTFASANPAAEKKTAGSLVLGGISITHPDRVISEIGHITKGELAEYYAGIASLILPHIARRPLSLLRCPSGIDKQFAARSMASTSGSSALRLGIASSING